MTISVVVGTLVIGLFAYHLSTNKTVESSTSETVELHGFAYEQPNLASNFVLIDQNGHDFTLSDHKGKVMLLFFGYTHCTDVCPLAMTKIGWIHENLGPDIARVVLLFVTVDPERDTPEVLRNYCDQYSGGITALTGSRENLESVWTSYGIFVNVTSNHDHHHGYSIDHTALIFVIDRNLTLRETFTLYDQNDEILADTRNLLRS